MNREVKYPQIVAISNINGTLYFNDVEKSLMAYNIEGNTYFKLRDLAKEIDFGVTWNEQSKMISMQSDSSYTE